MTKRTEHARRALEKRGPKAAALALCLAGALTVFFVMGRHMRLVTVKEVDTGETRVLYAGTMDEDELLRASGYTLGPDDAAVLALNESGGAELEVLRAFGVRITADGAGADVQVAHGTVAEALEKAGVVLSGDDYTEPALDSSVSEGMGEIVVHRVTYEERTETREVPFEVQYVTEGDPETSQYEHDILRSEGVNGQAVVTIRDRYVDGVYERSEEVGQEIVTEPVAEVHATVYNNVVSPLSAPEGVTVVDNVPTGYAEVYSMRATGYYSARGRGASGIGLAYGTFAVDPTLIPYGTKVYIASPDGSFVYGWAIATDTGAFIHTNRMQVDLFYETYAESAANGVKQVNVYVYPDVVLDEIK